MAKLYGIVTNDKQNDFQVEQPGALTVPSYQYQKLPSEGHHFRLLQLSPGDDYRLECSIASYALGSPDSPAYKALSYCWQNPKFDNLAINGRQIPEDDDLRSKYFICHPLWCDDKRILISTSLRDALLKLRSATQPVKLWVDALCINQEDLAERSSQVLLMQRIYHNAFEVCMWLGTEDQFTRRAFNLLNKLHDHVGKHHAGPSDLFNPRSIQRLGLPTFPSPDWEALIRLFERPYFRRIWIVQEMIAAPLGAMLYCGGLDPLPHTVVMKATSFLDSSNWSRPIDAHYGANNSLSFFSITFLIAREWIQGSATDTDRLRLRRMTQKTRRFEASDPRDKIFALIGIINDYGHRDLFGEDKPEGQGVPQTVAVKDGTLEATFKLDNRGKSKEDIAIEILLRQSDPAIKKLHTSLIDYLRGCLAIADVVQHPEDDHTSSSFMARYGAAAEKTIAGIGYIAQFRKDSRGISLDHQRVGDFAFQAFNMFSNSFMSYSGFIGHYCETDEFAFLCRTPQTQREVSSFREGTSWMLESLEPKAPSTEAETNKSKAEPKAPILIGDTETLNCMEYSVKLERQYPDWAWSAAGWKIPMYDMPTERIYTEYTVKCIQDDGNLDILSHVEDSSCRKLSGLPSWVPDFSVPLLRHSLARLKPGTDKSCYSASGSAGVNPKWSIGDSGVIELSGHEFDEISALASEESAGNKIKDQPEEWAAMIEGIPAEYPSGCHKNEALWRTLIGDSTTQDESPAPREYEKHYHTFRLLLRIDEELKRLVDDGADGPGALTRLCRENEAHPEDLPRLMEEKNKFEHRLAEVMLERRLFITKKSHIGAAPLSSRVGDAVCILAGGNVPYILRKHGRPGSLDAENTLYKLVGECYVHGVMHGEALESGGAQKSSPGSGSSEDPAYASRANSKRVSDESLLGRSSYVSSMKDLRLC